MQVAVEHTYKPFLLSAQKSAVKMLLEVMPPSAEAAGLAQAIERSGNHDSNVPLARALKDYVCTDLREMAASPEFRTRNEKTEMASRLVDYLVKQLTEQ